MRVLIVYAHPLDDSFNASLHARVRDTLRARGHEVDDCDLYAEGFDPLLTGEDLRVYRDVGANRRRVRPYVDRVLAAQGLALVFPVWNEGFPAILKGFLDRVFLPGVAFETTAEGKTQPGLRGVERLGAVCSYGAGRFATTLIGDPTRHVVKRLLRAMTGRSVRCDYLALYGMDRASPRRRAAFERKVERAFTRW
jgi:putative NADPH-quinone reductase